MDDEAICKIMRLLHLRFAMTGYIKVVQNPCGFDC
jgi:hypothetical protein